MAFTWTDDWPSAATVLTASHLANLQTNIGTLLHGTLLNANVSASGAIQERKFRFDVTSGHRHTGSDSTAINPAVRNYRYGLSVIRNSDNAIGINAGTLEIGGTLYNLTTATSLAPATAGDWVTGAEAATIFCYVYAYVSAGALAFKLSTEPPDLSYSDDTTTEYPLRYQKYASTYYRCLGAVWNDPDSNLEEIFVDLDHGVAAGTFLDNYVAGRADRVMKTIWTPKIVAVWHSDDATPIATEPFSEFWSTIRMDSQFTLLAGHQSAVEGYHSWRAGTAYQAGIHTYVKQSAGVAGGFTLEEPGVDTITHWMAWTDDFHADA